VENAVRELADFKTAGGGAMIDCMPCDAGATSRSWPKSRARAASISSPPRGSTASASTPRATGASARDPIGWPISSWRRSSGASTRTTAPAPTSAARPTGPRAQDRSDGAQLDDPERAAFEAVAAAHRRTGCPVITHCESGRGIEQVSFLSARGVEPRHIVLSHTDRHPDPAYHRELFRTGAFVEYDRAFRAPLDDANPTLQLFVAMVKEFPDQVMLGTDGARPSYWRSYGGSPGLDYLLLGFSDRARRRA